MEKYVVHCPPSPDNPKPSFLPPWERSVAELVGRYSPKYRHDVSTLLLESYSEMGAFPHEYESGGLACRTHMNRVINIANRNTSQVFLRRDGISALEFDSKGVYVASVTKSGCLTVHDFETLYCLSNGSSPYLKEDDTKHLLHLSMNQQLDVVRWNIANQDEVACTSVQSNEVLIFDIGYVSSEPVEVLRKRPAVTVHGFEVPRGLSDICFASSDKSSLLASDMSRAINLWDRRVSNLPCLELSTNSRSNLNSIQLNVENQIVFGAGKNGIIYAWDLRGERTSCAFQSHKEAQSDIRSKEVHSINLDPSCPYQLAFHLDDGWSGVLDTNNFQVTHALPTPCLVEWSRHVKQLFFTEKAILAAYKFGRIQTPLMYNIYAVGSSSDDGIHLLDFYPRPDSACHVDLNEEIQSNSDEKNKKTRNRFIPLSEGVSVCAAHPLNGTIIAGTKVCVS
ncbi:hypothetical protein C5167_045911 [Papaver somniferum]|uniref:Uncharacterized protein n=1 Tax=Papaver somniferum TaxID=3469 RepID=A0A4Y7LCB9_PAPSO|nr:hypothetical protein C5167_045911 [Papaver somniferum]